MGGSINTITGIASLALASAALALNPLHASNPLREPPGQTEPLDARKAIPPSQSLEPSNKPWPSKTWYVMLAIYEPRDLQRCESWAYKVSTHDPIVIKGPDTITPDHAQAVVNAWLSYLNARSPTAYQWINGAAGNHRNEIYFRKTEAEARADFAADGHLKRDKSCGGSVLLTHGVSKFRFVPSKDFTSPTFSLAPKPVSQYAGKVRDMANGPSKDDTD